MGEACKLARMVEESSYSTGRRGVAGTLIVEKIIGAAAEGGPGPRALINDIDPVPRARRRGFSRGATGAWRACRETATE